MHVLIAHAGRHGATQGIAQQIARTLRAAMIDAEVRPVASVRRIAGYDACPVRASRLTVQLQGRHPRET